MLQIAAWLLSLNQRKAPKSHLMQRPLDSSQRKGVGRRKPDGEGGRQCLQWQMSVRETDSKRDKEAAKQAQCSTAVQTAAAVSGCGRTDRPAGTDSSSGSSEQPNCPWILSGEEARACGGPWEEIHCSQ